MSGATGYIVDEWINGAWKQVDKTNSNGKSFTASGLSPGTSYSFDVAAVNAFGKAWANFESANDARPDPVSSRGSFLLDHDDFGKRD